MLPERVKASLLEQQHSEYRYYKDVWSTIADIRDGSATIIRKIDKYLPKRPGEDPEVYQLRKAKVAWTPVMATAIREFVAKLLSAPIHITGVEDAFWSIWRENTNSDGRDEPELLTRVFSSLLYFGRIYVAVDKPTLGFTPRSRYEEQQLAITPYVSIYEPLAVTNWGEGWYMTRQLETVNQPLELPKHIATWVVWDRTDITTYQAEVKLKDDGSIDRIKVDDRWENPENPACLIPVVKRTSHGLGVVPMLHLELPTELWTGNNVYLKQLQHFRVESSWTDAGTMAGIVQRLFTPPAPQPTTDYRVTYDEPDYNKVAFDGSQVLIGSDYKFAESPGTAIANLTSQLDKIEAQIRALVSLSSATASKGVLEQSGKSKEVDMQSLEETMKVYGTTIAKFYQDILQLVAVTASKVSDIVVTGLDNYGTNTLTEMLDQTEQLLKVDSLLPAIAKKTWYGKITNLMVGSRSATTDKLIEQQLESIDYQAKPVIDVGGGGKHY